MRKPPCYKDGQDCPRRYAGCHSECKDFKDWKAKLDEEKAIIKKKKDEQDVMYQIAVARTKKRRRKKK